MARGDGSIKDLRDAFLPKYRKEHKTLVLIRGELREEKIRVNFLEGMEAARNWRGIGEGLVRNSTESFGSSAGSREAARKRWGIVGK